MTTFKEGDLVIGVSGDEVYRRGGYNRERQEKRYSRKVFLIESVNFDQVSVLRISDKTRFSNRDSLRFDKL